LYIDDLIFTGSSKKLIAKCKAELALEFEMDIGLMHYFSVHVVDGSNKFE